MIQMNPLLVEVIGVGGNEKLLVTRHVRVRRVKAGERSVLRLMGEIEECFLMIFKFLLLSFYLNFSHF